MELNYLTIICNHLSKNRFKSSISGKNHHWILKLVGESCEEWNIYTANYFPTDY